MTSSARTTPLLSSKTVSYQYDAASNRTRLTWPDGYYATYNYDTLGNPTTVVDSGGTTLATYGYDDHARRTSLAYNGSTGASLSYGWTVEDDLTPLTNNLAGTTSDVTFTNTFTPAHQWASATTSNSGYIFAPAGTSSTAYTPNGLNQYTAVGGAAQIYDTRGNLTADGTATYVHDAENRLMIGPNGTSTYAYDPLGRRTAKTVPGTQTAPLWGTAVWNSFTWTAMPMVTTNFIHDGASEIAEYDGSGNLIRRFVPGPVIDEYIAMVTAGGTKTFFHTDKMGSVIGMSDTSGALTEGPFTYDAYGNCMSGGGLCAATDVPFRFTGQRYDGGLYYYKARYYDPAKGRFIETDPIGYKDDLNLYAYVRNDPTDRIDPSGLCIPTACKGWDSFGGIEACNAANGGCGGGWGGGTQSQREAVLAVQRAGSFTIPSFATTRGCSSCPQIAANGPFVAKPQTAAPVKTNPLDPGGINKPLTPVDMQGVADTLNKFVNGTITGHPYFNRVTPTGAVLPPAPQGYTTFDVDIGAKGPGPARLIINNATGAMYYTNNHYLTYYEWNLTP